ncbi:sn-glycerol-3-phosphate ABC transporter ATP-binding protein UgpC [Nitratireductor aquimarinus]|uniref:ABC transporter ATP-binding protein n=1 Tax=Nitratireductor TaxID=245876 RepID=UPI0019D36BFC|nr:MULTISPECIES: sn-glycerol-3-phosphate ABC transporter ATP-binding protein UgpC [Nitratireductor]MBN7776924.1 sn-glycerol-3-phosphate ABC transporter ATP-binding protein UgpC [Nitratireductor pacificus]MBN7780258.1 sn-glycerol-3-phosphate ABC transporter ATP-binding protein UgpC [Nitratireductor pacificus]MBN7789065.1 sn-glycerol-3-phosphate ABC transporter ATP-binding protein UgpC [Nitratireductor aquimarinus]MBY6099133.1 sn-glycerol-3-phosphate ABC transporter ATP-binding protein UgpC [Nitr
MATLNLRKLVKTYGKVEVLHGIDLDVADGEFVVFVGPSGCGKSTTLRMIAGLEEVTGGEIHIGDRLVNNLEPKDRDIAMVFQNYAIYPHMSVRKNIGFGLRTSKLSKEDKDRRIDEVAAILGMTDLLERRPNQLSGGQRQRVAIGRAMVRDPAVFLFDEPLSNLDAQLRTQMRLEIKKLHQRVGNTIIFVTHDQVEAMTMADRIVIMKDGYIQQVGTPLEVYHKPANTFVAQFIGAPSMNMLPGTWNGNGVKLGDGLGIELPRRKAAEGADVVVGVRPDDLVVTGGKGLFSGKVNIVEPLGADTLVYVGVNGYEVIAKASGREPPKPGETVNLTASAGEMHLFDAKSGEALP